MITVTNSRRLSLAIVLTSSLLGACADDAPVAPDRKLDLPGQLATVPGMDTDGAIATLQRVTARYHDLSVALADTFQLLHPCETRPGEGPVGIVYVNVARLLDGVVDPQSPDALIYEPSSTGSPNLVGVEFAVPNLGQAPPKFLGATFQPEDEFGVYALHAWVWSYNPEGLFAETNPRISCGIS